MAFLDLLGGFEKSNLPARDAKPLKLQGFNRISRWSGKLYGLLSCLKWSRVEQKGIEVLSQNKNTLIYLCFDR